MEMIEKIRAKKGFLCDMDGVIYHGNMLLPGVKEFLNWLIKNDKKFLFLTNGSGRSPLELSQKLSRMGLDVDESHFYTSALATAHFLKHQKPGCSVYCIGDAGLHNALYNAGIVMNDVSPDYVVIGETTTYSYQNICKAAELVTNGARLIGTNPDMTTPIENNVSVPACRALVAPVELATGKQAYFLGKPNPLMMRMGMRMLDCFTNDTAIIGDRMDTDIISGIESGIDTVLVLSGVTAREDVDKMPYSPRLILNNVGELAD